MTPTTEAMPVLCPTCQQPKSWSWCTDKFHERGVNAPTTETRESLRALADQIAANGWTFADPAELRARADELARGQAVRLFEGIPFRLTEDDGGDFVEATSMGDNGNCVSIGTVHRMPRHEWDAAQPAPQPHAPGPTAGPYRVSGKTSILAPDGSQYAYVSATTIEPLSLLAEALNVRAETGLELRQLAEEVARLKEELAAARREANRRDEKWMAGLDEIFGPNDWNASISDPSPNTPERKWNAVTAERDALLLALEKIAQSGPAHVKVAIAEAALAADRKDGGK